MLNDAAYRSLELDKIKALLLSLAGSIRGRELVTALVPADDLTRVRESLAVTGEGVRLLSELGRQPYHDLPDVGSYLPALHVGGYHLEPAALLAIASFIEGGFEIADRIARAEGAPRLSSRAAGVSDRTPVAASIRRAILPSAEVADDASPQLAETRRTIARLKLRLHSVMESYLKGKEADRLLQEKLITTRNDRFVLLLKAEHRGQLPGIIHGSSGSGASLFVEPMPAVELNNDLVALGDEERREVIRILKELTARVAEIAGDLAVAQEILGELDEAQAKGLLARDMNATAPEMVEALELELRDARHPLLMARTCEKLGIPRRSTRDPVPVSIRLRAGEPVLVISGPNTGGKTVALKTVGLLSLMAQCGLHIPASSGSRLPAFRCVYADIGDEQSIAADLSTFSAHLAAIVAMTRDLVPPVLVLIDELGAGTDPTEGGALGVAIVEHFRRRNAMVVTTTHHGQMKAYAQSTPGVVCASFGYVPDTYEPTYRLSLGVPGRSLALEMAERLGLPAEIVADARARRDQKEAQAEALLKKLEDDQAALDREEARLTEARRGLEIARAALREKEREIDDRKRAEIQAFAAELRKRSDEMARQAADAIHQAVARVQAAPRSVASTGEKARSRALEAIRTVREAALAGPEFAELREDETPALPLQVGGRVKVRELGVVGEVIALGASDAEVAVSGKRLRVPRASVLALAPPGVGRVGSVTVARARDSSEVASEINLVGLTVDEAIPRVDKLLDQAAMAEKKRIRVVHGFGAGRLRQAVAGLLEGHPHVAAYRQGESGEGGGGVTIVELKD